MSLGDMYEQQIIAMGRGQIISKKDIQAYPGDYPIYSSAATNDGVFGHYGKWMFDDVRITWSVDGGGKFFYRTDKVPYSVTNVCGWLKVLSPVLNIRFLYYLLMSEWSQKTYDYVHKAHPSVIRKEYTVSLPPLSIQNLIVLTLDRLDSYVHDLSSGLPAEIEARQRQYEWWRDSLLSFREKEVA